MTIFESSDIGKQLTKQIKQYQKDLGDGNFDDAVSFYLPSASIYSPYGILQGVAYSGEPAADAKTTAAWFKIFADQGIKSYTFPSYVDGTVYGDVAVTTFLLQGVASLGGNQPQEEIVLRVTEVWVNQGNAWKIAHMHVSRSYTTGNGSGTTAILA
jgi:hypothetical protein